MDVEENSKESKYKLLILFLKFIPVSTALCYMLNTLSNYFGYSIEFLSNLGGMSLFTWIFVYLASIVFDFCVYHRLLLWYVLIDDIINIIDYYWHIPVSTDNILMLHNILMGTTILTITVLYVKNHKRTPA